MHSIHRALLWEFMARGRWIVPFCFAVGTSIPFLVNAALSHSGLPWTEPIWIALQIGFLPFLMITSAVGIADAHGDVSRLYTAPVSNRTIVLWHIVPGSVILACQVAIFATVANLLFESNWPVLGPSLAAGACWALFQPVYHMTQRTLVATVLLSLPLVGFTFWFHSRFGGWFTKPTHPWTDVTASEILTLLGFNVFAYAEFLYIIGKGRCGESTLSIEPWLATLKAAWPKKNTPLKPFATFRSAQSAQFWYQWRQKGLALPLMFVVFLFTIGTSMLIKFSMNSPNVDDFEDIRKVIVLFGLYIIGISGMAGFFFAISNIRSANNKSLGFLADGLYIYDLCAFQATKPVSSKSLSYALLKTCGLSVILTWALWLTSLFVVISLAWINQKPFQTLLPENFGNWLFPMVLVLSWIAVTTVTLIGISGRGTSIILSGSAVIGIYVVFSIAIEMTAPQNIVVVAQRITAGMMCVFAIAYSIGTATVSVRRELIPKVTTLYMAAGAIAITVATLAIAPRVDTSLAWLATLAMSCLAVHPFAAFPLAFACNRTR